MKLNGKLEPHQDPGAQSSIHQGWAQVLLATTNVLSDTYAAALAYAHAKHGDRIKREEVLSLMQTAYVQMTKQGGAHVA